MKRACVAILVLTAIFGSVRAQQKLVDEVKISINVLNPTVDTYKNALKKLQPALTANATKDKAETWFVAGNAAMGIYDMNVNIASLGKSDNKAEMTTALLTSYDHYIKALLLDTVVLKDKKGNPKIDKKTKQIKIQTKFSSEIIKRLGKHAGDYLNMGFNRFENKDHENSFKLWQIHEKILALPSVTVLPDSVMGKISYYQAINLYYLSRYSEVPAWIEKAQALGVENKLQHDIVIDCYNRLNNSEASVQAVIDAWHKYGDKDINYAKILINHYIEKDDMPQANVLIDNVLQAEPNNDVVMNLKGVVTEEVSGLDSAFVFFNRAIEINPDNTDGQFNVGRYYYNKAIKFKQDHPRKMTKKQKKQLEDLYREALPHFEVAYRHDKSNSALRDALMNIYYQLGDGNKLKEIEAYN